MAHVIHLPDAVLTVFDVYALLLVVMTAVVILQKRALVATLLRGNLSAAQPNLLMACVLAPDAGAALASLGDRLPDSRFRDHGAGRLHGFVVMLRGTILSLLILFVMRMLFGATNRWGASDATAGAALHHAILRLLTRGVNLILAALAFAAAWGADLGEMFATPFGHRMLDAMFSIGATVIILAMIYEAFSGMIERHLSRRDEDGTAQISPRMRTLLPMIRNTVFIVAAVVVALVALSEVGVNIGPLLAGAGVLGVAVGFGSQTLVKDFLTGLFIVVENTIAIGDVVQIGTHSGVVDAMSVRTLRLGTARAPCISCPTAR